MTYRIGKTEGCDRKRADGIFGATSQPVIIAHVYTRAEYI